MRALTSTIADSIYKIRGIAHYQFDEAIGQFLFPDDCEIEYSRKTNKIRRITLHSKVLATIRARDGRLVLTMWGAQRLHQSVAFPRLRVVVPQDIATYIAKGRSVFAKHVQQVDPRLRAGDEVLVVDDSDNLLAVGTARVSPREMIDLTRGVAVRCRHSLSKTEISAK